MVSGHFFEGVSHNLRSGIFSFFVYVGGCDATGEITARCDLMVFAHAATCSEQRAMEGVRRSNFLVLFMLRALRGRQTSRLVNRKGTGYACRLPRTSGS